MLLAELMKSEAGTYSQYKLDYDRAVQNYAREYTYVNLLNKPFPADKKAYPIRWIIIVVTAFIVFFTAVLTIIIVENYTKLQLKKNFSSQ